MWTRCCMCRQRWRCIRARRPGNPVHLRNRDGTAEQPAADVFPACQSSLSERTLSGTDTGGCSGAGDDLPGVRRAFLCARCGRAGLQQPGACKNCGGTGTVRTVDESTLVPDESLTIDEGAVAPWNSLMWSLMTDVCRAWASARMCRSGI